MTRKVFAEPKKNFYYIREKSSKGFKTIRTHDVGKPKGLMRVAGKNGGKWETIGYLLEKRILNTPRGKHAVELIEKKHGIDVVFPEEED